MKYEMAKLIQKLYQYMKYWMDLGTVKWDENETFQGEKKSHKKEVPLPVFEDIVSASWPAGCYWEVVGSFSSQV